MEPNIRALIAFGVSLFRSRTPQKFSENSLRHRSKSFQPEPCAQCGCWPPTSASRSPAPLILRPHGTAYWLRERNVLCPDCRERDQRVLEYPLTGIPSARYSPHDSGYL